MLTWSLTWRHFWEFYPQDGGIDTERNYVCVTLCIASLSTATWVRCHSFAQVHNDVSNRRGDNKLRPANIASCPRSTAAQARLWSSKSVTHLISARFISSLSLLWRCWLGGRKGIRPVKKLWVVGCWRGYLSGARCRLACGQADVTATHCLLLQ